MVFLFFFLYGLMIMMYDELMLGEFVLYILYQLGSCRTI